jgi:hypothetical protein
MAASGQLRVLNHSIIIDLQYANAGLNFKWKTANFNHQIFGEICSMASTLPLSRPSRHFRSRHLPMFNTALGEALAD